MLPGIKIDIILKGVGFCLMADFRPDGGRIRVASSVLCHCWQQTNRNGKQTLKRGVKRRVEPDPKLNREVWKNVYPVVNISRS